MNKFNIITSHSWDVNSTGRSEVESILSDTISNIMEEDERVINVQMVNEDNNGLRRFYIYTENISTEF